jgi:hypothetical protein
MPVPGTLTRGVSAIVAQFLRRFLLLGNGNAIWDFADKKLHLRCCQTLYSEIRTNNQTQTYLRLVK